MPAALTIAQSREFDRHAIETLGVPGVVLMENAGRGIVDVLLEIDPALVAAKGRVAILCGKGNNAGDGLVVARHLAIRSVATVSVLLAPPEELVGDARTNFEIAVRCGLPIVDLAAAPRETLAARLDEASHGASWLVDALLGTGARGEPREPFATAIRWMNSHAARRLAIDVPSGLDADSGHPSPATVRADVTCACGAMKVGFLTPPAAEWIGEVRVVSLGLPPEGEDRG